MDTQHGKNWFKRHKVLTVVLAVLIILPLIAALGGGEPKATGVAKYDAVIESYKEQDPATLVVRVKVHNTGNASGKPTCTVEADNSTRAYHGINTFVRDTELEPDGYWGFNGTVTVTNQGAQYVKDVTVQCK
jgi:hypothetical protein